jgi:hypothetical protein
VTEDQKSLCRELVVQADGRARITKSEFLRRFPSAVEGGKLAVHLLEDAALSLDDDELQCTLIVGFTFGFALVHKDILSSLVDADWHHSHEDIVEALDELRTPEVADALFRATQWVPKSLEFDSSRALGVKAIWALGRLPGPSAESMLERIALSSSEALRIAAVEQLERRRKKG